MKSLPLRLFTPYVTGAYEDYSLGSFKQPNINNEDAESVRLLSFIQSNPAGSIRFNISQDLATIKLLSQAVNVLYTISIQDNSRVFVFVSSLASR